MINPGTSIAIIIDCCQAADSSLINNIKKTCVECHDIKTIVLASYTSEDKISSKDPGVNHAKSFFYDETKFDELRNQWQSCICDAPAQTHAELVGNWYREDQNLITACTSLQLLYYCNFIQPDINKIYFFGQAWDICVKSRPVGWMQLSALQYHQLFHTHKHFVSRPECVADINGNTLKTFDYPWLKMLNGDWYLKNYVWE